MINKLRIRLTVLVVAVLALVTAGIVLSIHTLNLRNIDAAATSALNTLAENEGRRPGRDAGESRSPSYQIEPPEGNQAPALRGGETPPPKPDGEADPGEAPPPKPDGEPDPDGTPPPKPDGEPPSDGGRRDFELPLGGDSLANLSNAYTIRLDGDGAVTEWISDRADLYTDDQIQAIADAILADGKASGRVGTQYYRLTASDDGRLLVVLDARLEFLSAQRTLRATALVASLACVLLSIGATLLIRRMLRPVQMSFDRQKQFVWDASHEFKTPLAVISANAEVLNRELGPNEYLGYIQSEVRRADNLVQNLLTLARMDKGTVTARLERVNLSEALLEVALPFESTVFEAGKTLETDIPAGVYCRGDAAMLQQLTVILLSNALKYSNEGGLIRLSLAQRGRGATITVYNTGPGIAPEHLEKIFDRFYREDTSHNSAVAGNGLGLAIARDIVEAHRGRIRAESEYGKSATFIVTLGG